MRNIHRLLEGRLFPLFFAITLYLLLPLKSSLAQSTRPKVPVGKSDFAIVDGEVASARSGNLTATVDLAHEMFRNAGIAPQIADAFGYTTRVTQAQRNYLMGRSTAIHEQDVVAAVNRFANSLELPSWAHTNQEEVRRLRVHLFLALPHLFGNREAPDAHHHHQLLSASMSPMEAGYLATAMLYLKAFDPEFQFSEAERNLYTSQGATVWAAEREKRLGVMQKVVTGHSDSVSVADILPAADELFTDLGMPGASPSARLMQLLPNLTAARKGGL